MVVRNGRRKGWAEGMLSGGTKGDDGAVVVTGGDDGVGAVGGAVAGLGRGVRESRRRG